MMIKLIIGIGIVLVIIGAGAGIGLGLGKGIGEENGDSEIVSESDMAKESGFITVKVEESSIWIDDVECADIEELKDTISRYQSAGNIKEYVFEHDYAIKSTYDEVKKALSDLEQTLGITVKYN